MIGATAGRGEPDADKAAESNGLIAIKSSDDGSFTADFVWKAKRATSSFGSPIAHQGHAYFVNATGVLFCLNLETGDELFSNRIGGSIWATPLPMGDRICFFGKTGTVSVVSTGSKFESLAENVTWDATTSAPNPAANEAGGQRATGRSFGGAILYAAVFANDRLLLRRGDKLYCIVAKSRSA